LPRCEGCGGEKEGVARERAASGTGGATEDAGGSDSKDKEAIEGNIAIIDSEKGARAGWETGKRGERREFSRTRSWGRGWRGHETSV